jgi:hypothetical protein
MQKQHLSRMSRELFDKLERAFRPRPIDPDTPHDVIMFEAGAMSVIRFIEAELSNTDTTSVVSGAAHVQPISTNELFRQAISRGNT